MARSKTVREIPKANSELIPVSGSTEAKEFRKTNEAIGLRVKEGRLSLLSRKLYNVMVYHAQQLKTPGLNAPIETEAAKKYFWIPLSEVARDAAYDSNDTEFLKQAIEEFQNIKIHIEDDRQWTSERLVSSVKLVNPLGLKKRGGVMWFGFAFPPEVHELVMSPGTYTKLSIFYQGLLRSGSALALYEICRRYATNPSKLTGIETYEYWHSTLTGNPMREVPPPYKYFKRDILKPAMAEINSTTDIMVDLIEHKNGRRIEKLQFHVELNKQSSLAFPAPPVIDSDLMLKIMRFGFSQQDSLDLMAQHSDDKIRVAVAHLETRLASATLPKIDSKAAYFRTLLKNGLVQTESPGLPKPKYQQKNDTAISVMERFLSHRAKQAFDIINEMTAEERSVVLVRFKQTPESKSLKFTRSIEHPMIKASLGRWYAAELWGEPSANDIVAFVENSQILGSI